MAKKIAPNATDVFLKALFVAVGVTVAVALPVAVAWKFTVAKTKLST